MLKSPELMNGGSDSGGSICPYATLDPPYIFSLPCQKQYRAWLALGHLVLAPHAWRAAWIGAGRLASGHLGPLPLQTCP